MPNAKSNDEIHWPPEFQPAKGVISPVHMRNEVQIAASPERVWDWLVRAPCWPEWYPNSANVRLPDARESDLKKDMIFRWRTFGTNLSSKVVEYEPCKRLAWDGRGLGIRVYHAWLLQPVDGDKCRVLTEESQRGWRCWLGKIFLPHRMSKFHQIWLEKLKEKAESGQSPACPSIPQRRQKMVKSSFGLILWLLGMLAVVATGFWSIGKKPDDPGLQREQIVDIAPDQSTVRVAPLTQATSRTTTLVSIPADKKDLRALLKSFHRGDLVTLQYEKNALTDLHVDTPEVSAWQISATIVGSALLLFLFAWAVLGKGALAGLILGIDGLYSKSKFQLFVWFGVLMVAYLSTLWLRFCYSSNWLLGAVQIPPNLLVLSGFSALSFVGAKAITQTKQDRVDAAVAKGVPGAADLYKTNVTGRAPNLVYDLTHDDSVHADLGDFQMVLITSVAAITYIVQVFLFLRAFPLSATVTLPDVDSTLLAAFGLGQGAYLMKKAASGSNPDPNPTQGGGAAANQAPPAKPAAHKTPVGEA